MVGFAGGANGAGAGVGVGIGAGAGAGAGAGCGETVVFAGVTGAPSILIFGK